MGTIKKIIGRTSRKILSAIVPNCHSQELILNQPAQPGDILHKSTKQRVARLNKKLRKSNGKDTAVAEALLLAAMNYLPPVQFHHVHGPNAQLSSNKCVARRTQSFCQALVFSSRVVLPDERVYIKVLEIAKGWSGTIRFGFTAVDPATLAYRMPKHACPDMTNAGHTWARALADEVVRRNSVIHFSYNKDGFIHYGINNQDCGIFHANVNTNQNLWFIVDIYGLTAAVELIDPRVNNGSGGEFVFPVDDRSTMYKSTSVMEDIFGSRHQSANSRSRRKQSRKAARHAVAAGIIHGNWPLEERSLDPRFSRNQTQAHQLPNLNSHSLPSAQQNIYSPMPISQSVDGRQHPAMSQLRTDSHDYHQISSANNINLYSTNSVYQPVIRGQPKLNGAASIANLSHATVNSASAPLSQSSTLNTSSTLDNFNCHQIDQGYDLCGRFEGINLNSNGEHSLTPGQSLLSRSSKSSNPHHAPVPATRREQQQTKTKRSPERAAQQTKALNHRVGSSTSKLLQTSSSVPSSVVLSPGPASSQATTRTSNEHEQSSASGKENVKPKVRHSIKQKSSISTTRDSNNNNPPSKDCPICFERPINCVLYQCGHMCTCYECGVKQWKTQSRTCPICRTIIKDVIKTYMS